MTGYVLGVTGIGIESCWLKPKRFACLRMALPPNCMPSSANGILHDRICAVAIETVVPGPHVEKVSLWTTALEPGSVSALGFGSWLSLVKAPEPNAVALTIG